jgi:hypothetical protein
LSDDIGELSTLGINIAREMMRRLGEIDDIVIGFQEDGSPVTARFDGEKPGDLAIEQAVTFVRSQSGNDKVITILGKSEEVALTVRDGFNMSSHFYRYVWDSLKKLVDIELSSTVQTVELSQ